MHHRRKRKSYSVGSGRHYGILEQEGPSAEMRNVDPTNTMEEKEMSIVISDSDSLELEEDISVRQKRANHRKTLAAKRKIARMTEEEQLALAVKISQQEQATCTKHKQDDELMKKVIEESLHSCNISHNLSAATSYGLPVDLSFCEDVLAKQNKDSSLKSYISGQDPSHSPEVHLTCQNIVETACSMSFAEDVILDKQSEEHLSQQCWMLDQGPSQSPKVLLKRLSQDIVESTSVILSPNCRDPFSCFANGKASLPLAQSNISDFVRLSPPKASLSPVFPVKSPYACRMTTTRLFPGKSQRFVSPRNTMDDSCSHCSESPQLDSASLVSNAKSEVTEDGSSAQNKDLCSKKQDSCIAIMDKRHVSAKSESSFIKGGKEHKKNGSIHYYWGIPFCPKGVDPNTYTQVILCQLEAYQKCLKNTQSHLLHKMEYCQPINLTGSLEINDQKNNLGSVSQEDTKEIVDVSDQLKHQSPLEPKDESVGLEIQPVSTEKSKFSHGALQQSQEEDHSCPLEEQPVKQPTQEPFTNLLDGCEGVVRVLLGESSIPPVDVSDENCPKEHIEIDQEEEVTSCPETPLSSDTQEDSAQIGKSNLTENIPESSQMPCPNGPEEIVSYEPGCAQDVECPMCCCKFSQNQIERHAAYCDGAKEEAEMAVLRPRNRLSRRTNDGELDGAPSSDSGKYEKCYLCKSLVLLKDYHVHVDSCLKVASLENRGTRRLKNTKQAEMREGRLLSMLEHTEAISADENKAKDFSCLRPPREDHPDGPNHQSVSDSPIRSFLSISEATDCLVDFKKQFDSRLDRQSNKRGPKNRGRGKRRRM